MDALLKRNIKTWYNNLSSRYEMRYRGFIGSRRDSFEKQILKRMLSVKKDDTVLEVGTGTGRYAIDLSSRCAFVVGIDFSEEMIKIAEKKRRESSIENVQFIIADADHIPLKECFNAVFSVSMFTEFDRSIDQAVSEMKRCVMPNGVVVSNAWNYFGLTRLLFKLFEHIYHLGRYNKNARSEYPFKPHEFTEKFEKCGLDTVEIIGNGYLLFTLFEIIIHSFGRMIPRYFDDIIYFISIHLEFFDFKAGTITPLKYFGSNIYIKCIKR